LLWFGGGFFVAMIAVIIYDFGFSGVTPMQSVAAAAIFGKQSYARVNGLIQFLCCRSL